MWLGFNVTRIYGINRRGYGFKSTIKSTILSLIFFFYFLPANLHEQYRISTNILHINPSCAVKAKQTVCGTLSWKHALSC